MTRREDLTEAEREAAVQGVCDDPHAPVPWPELGPHYHPRHGRPPDADAESARALAAAFRAAIAARRAAGSPGDG